MMRLQRLLEQDSLRTGFRRQPERTVAEYNREKNRVTIEKTFEALLRFMDGFPVDAYDETEVDEKSEAVFVHIFRTYPTVPSPYYAAAS